MVKTKMEGMPCMKIEDGEEVYYEWLWTAQGAAPTVRWVLRQPKDSTLHHT